jgi:hypothetical protein
MHYNIKLILYKVCNSYLKSLYEAKRIRKGIIILIIIFKEV